MQNTNKPKLKTFSQVLKSAEKSTVFRQVYSEELTRLRLASEIRKLRMKKNLTQKTIANLVDMPQSVIARIESGKVNISIGTLDRIAQALGKEVQLA